MNLSQILNVQEYALRVLKTEVNSLDFYFHCRDLVEAIQTLDTKPLYTFISHSSSIEDKPYKHLSMPTTQDDSYYLEFLLNRIYDAKGSKSKRIHKFLNTAAERWLSLAQNTLESCSGIVSYCTNHSNIRAYFNIPDSYTIEELNPYEYIAYRKIDDESFYVWRFHWLIEHFRFSIMEVHRDNATYGYLKHVAKHYWPEDHI